MKNSYKFINQFISIKLDSFTNALHFNYVFLFLVFFNKSDTEDEIAKLEIFSFLFK